MKNTSKHILIGAVGLLATNTPLHASQPITNTTSQSKMETLNAASLKTMESTWLEVSKSCKARGFHADPEQLIQQKAGSDIQAIYASYEV